MPKRKKRDNAAAISAKYAQIPRLQAVSVPTSLQTREPEGVEGTQGAHPLDDTELSDVQTSVGFDLPFASRRVKS
jgi:hypothetical protein